MNNIDVEKKTTSIMNVCLVKNLILIIWYHRMTITSTKVILNYSIRFHENLIFHTFIPVDFRVQLHVKRR
jgi:hypothetical protein